jgi:hypothetical protein
VELFGGGEARGEMVLQTCGIGQIDAPELDLAGLEWRKDVDLFPITQDKRHGGFVRCIAIIISCLGTLVLQQAEQTMKYWEIYNFQVSMRAIVCIDFSNCAYN